MYFVCRFETQFFTEDNFVMSKNPGLLKINLNSTFNDNMRLLSQ